MDDIKQALQALADRHGGEITPEMVVEAAADPESPLHECFEWDDEAAGHKYRIVQARAIIRSVRISVTTVSCTYNVPCYVRDPSAAPDKQGYVSLPRLKSDTEMARDAVVQEFARARSVLERAKDLAAVLGFDDRVEKVIGDVVELRQVALDYEADGARVG